ncbi:hypothetical protein, partial [Vibrio crassostreae]|uniref:hypothetical protein n=1 Tax=Vibrio crassostreae TaxID=246167 RepID=UPI001B3114EB
MDANKNIEDKPHYEYDDQIKTSIVKEQTERLEEHQRIVRSLEQESEKYVVYNASKDDFKKMLAMDVISRDEDAIRKMLLESKRKIDIDEIEDPARAVALFTKVYEEEYAPLFNSDEESFNEKVNKLTDSVYKEESKILSHHIKNNDIKSVGMMFGADEKQNFALLLKDLHDTKTETVFDTENKKKVAIFVAKSAATFGALTLASPMIGVVAPAAGAFAAKAILSKMGFAVLAKTGVIDAVNRNVAARISTVVSKNKHANTLMKKLNEKPLLKAALGGIATVCALYAGTSIADAMSDVNLTEMKASLKDAFGAENINTENTLGEANQAMSANSYEPTPEEIQERFEQLKEKHPEAPESVLENNARISLLAEHEESLANQADTPQEQPKQAPNGEERAETESQKQVAGEYEPTPEEIQERFEQLKEMHPEAPESVLENNARISLLAEHEESLANQADTPQEQPKQAPNGEERAETESQKQVAGEYEPTPEEIQERFEQLKEMHPEAPESVLENNARISLLAEHEESLANQADT